MPTLYAGDCDLSKVRFGPFTNTNNRQSVEVYLDGCGNKNKLRVSLACDTDEPLEAKFPLDRVQDDGNPDRRGQSVLIKEPRCIKSLEDLDNAIIKEAVVRSKEWFKKALTEEEVRARYQAQANKETDDGGREAVITKCKVKCGNSQYPTALHLREGINGPIRKKGGRVEHLEQWGNLLVPIVSAHALWFMAGGSRFGISFQIEEMIVTLGDTESGLPQFPSRNKLTVIDGEEKETGRAEAGAEGASAVVLEGAE